MLFREIPATRYDRAGLYPQAGLIVGFWALLKLHEAFTGFAIPPGYAIGCLAVVAVVISARGNALQGAEKIIWIAICGALFVWELRVLDQQHIEQEREHLADLREQRQQFETARNSEQAHFTATAKGLQDSISGLATILHTAEKSQKLATGGNSFIYFEPYLVFPTDKISPTPGYEPGNFGVQTVGELFGDYPLRDVIVRRFCPTRSVDSVEIRFGNLYKGSTFPKLDLEFPPDKKYMYCNIYVSASNGDYIQSFRFVPNGADWLWKSSIKKMPDGRILRTESGTVP